MVGVQRELRKEMSQSIAFVVENYMNPKNVLQFIELIFCANDHKILAAIIWDTH